MVLIFTWKSRLIEFAMANLDFSDLLQTAEQLTSEFDPFTTVSDLPRVERNLHQLVNDIFLGLF